MTNHLDRDISEEHANKLLRAMRMREHEQVPEGVKDQYWKMKSACDRLNIHPSDQLLIMVVMTAGELPEGAEPTFVEMVQAGKVERDSPVIVMWRKKAVEGRFLSLRADGMVLVSLLDEERHVKPETVSLADLVEA